MAMVFTQPIIERDPEKKFFRIKANPPGRPYIRENILGYEDIEIGFGAVVNGSIYSKRNALLEHGVIVNGSIQANDKLVIQGGSYSTETYDTPTIIVGSIMGKNVTLGEHPKSRAQLSYWKEKPLVVIGDVMADYIDLQNGVVIYGNLFVNKRLLVNGKTYVSGIITINDETSEIEIKDTTAFTVMSKGKIIFGKGSTIVYPFSVANEIVVKDKVRYIGKYCMECQEQNKSFCSKYLNGECGEFDYIDERYIYKKKIGVRTASIMSIQLHYSKRIVGEIMEGAYSLLNQELLSTEARKEQIREYMEKIKHEQSTLNLQQITKILEKPVTEEEAKWKAWAEVKKKEIEAELEKFKLMVSERTKFIEKLL